MTYIYRKRSVKNRYGFGKVNKTFQVHMGKRSLYLFVPFWNVRSITDNMGTVKVS